MGHGHQLVGVWPECPASAKIKTTKIYSEESERFSAKICTSENLYQRKFPAIRYLLFVLYSLDSYHKRPGYCSVVALAGSRKVMSSYHRGRHCGPCFVCGKQQPHYDHFCALSNGEKRFMKQHVGSDIPELG